MCLFRSNCETLHTFCEWVTYLSSFTSCESTHHDSVGLLSLNRSGGRARRVRLALDEKGAHVRSRARRTLRRARRWTPRAASHRARDAPRRSGRTRRRSTGDVGRSGE